MGEDKDYNLYHQAAKNVGCNLVTVLISKMMDGYEEPKYPDKVGKYAWTELDLSDIPRDSIETFCNSLQEKLIDLKERVGVPKDIPYTMDLDFYNEDLTFYFEGDPSAYDLEKYQEELSEYAAMEKWKDVVDAEYEKLVIENNERHNYLINKQIEELKSKLK